MNLGTLKTLGVPLSLDGLQAALTWVVELASTVSGGFVCFINIHAVRESHWNSKLSSTLKEASLSVADGSLLVWLPRFAGSPINPLVLVPTV